jgi:hypothetical protein
MDRPKKELAVNITQDVTIRCNDLLEFHVDEVIKGVDMLLYETLDLEECRKKVPFVAGGIDGFRQGFVGVEGFEECVKALIRVGQRRASPRGQMGGLLYIGVVCLLSPLFILATSSLLGLCS